MASPLRVGSRKRGRLERQLLAGGTRVAGVDEVGRGCLAGPIYAACAVVDFAQLRKLKSTERQLIRDSKQLSHQQRAAIVPVLQTICPVWEIASASVEEIERLGIAPANFLAMRRALTVCREAFDLLLVDGKWKIPGWDGDQQTVIKGDSLCYSIAAASILAKEARDAYMREQAQLYPQYGFEAHVGYGTRQHLAMIEQHGICPLHRKTFEPIRAYIPKAVRSDTPLFE
jgi:ribonuclease HII